MIKPSDSCLPISHDVSKDWSHYRYFSKRLFGGLTFPDFMLDIQGIKDQKDSDFCTAFCTSEAIGNQVGIPMSAEYQTAQIGKLAGAPIFGGADPKLALKAGTIGCLPQTNSPFSFERDGFQTPALWQSYNANLDPIAALYKRAGWYNVLFGGPNDYDAYDMTCLALNDARADNAPIMGFGFWYNEWTEAANNPACKGIMPVPTTPVSRHAYLSAVGLQTIGGEQKIVAQLSQGEDFGDKGLCYYGRDAWNAAWQDPVKNQIGMYIYRSKNPPIFNLVLEFINGLWHYVAG